MLSRSSLETQKLELLSAMSDLKLKQAALERENLELRTSNINNNNNLMNRRPPAPPGRVLMNSTPNNSPINLAAPLHSSHGNLQQNTNPITPKVLFY